MNVYVFYQDENGNLIPVTPDSPLPVTGGGGGSSDVTVTNFPATQAVTGPLTNAQFTAVAGTAATAAWNGTDASATMIGILKAMYTVLAMMNMEVNEIDQDMDVVKALLNDIKANTSSS